jgi:hypothetical protein
MIFVIVQSVARLAGYSIEQGETIFGTVRKGHVYVSVL